MAGQKYNKAYEAYQQAVYRDGRNPTFWCSIGVLYFQINQFRDALDAYSRAIRINPYISEVWFDLGSLYESCNNQITDAIDAYARASELDPSNVAIAQRLQLLKNAQATGVQLPAAPGPQDVHPTAYASSVVPPPGLSGPPLMLQSSGHRPPFRSESRGPSNEISLGPGPPNGRGSPPPPPFRGGPPPPVILDESRHVPSHTPLAPMEIDRPHHGGREFPPSRDQGRGGPIGHQSLLLQHPLPPQEDHRNGHPHHPDPYFNRAARPRSRSISPAIQHSGRPRSPLPGFQGYPPQVRQPVGPAQPSGIPAQRGSPRNYHRREPSHPEQEQGWERRAPPPTDHREWERDERRQRHGSEYMQHGAPQSSFYPPRSPRAYSPREPSPRGVHPTRHWESKPTGVPSVHPGFRGSPPPPQPAMHHEQPRMTSRYDPRNDGRDTRDYDMERRSYPVSPDSMRATRHGPTHIAVGSHSRASESPLATPQLTDAKRRRKERDEIQTLPHSQGPQPPPPQQQLPPQFSPQASSTIQDPVPKKERRKRTNGKRKEEEGSAEHRGPATFKTSHAYPKGPGSPENSSNSGSSRSIQPSPTSAAPRPPSRVVDEDYDEGVAETLIGLSTGLASYRGAENPISGSEGPSHSPTVSSHSRLSDPLTRPPPSHRNSVSSNQVSPQPQTSQSAPLKRALSPGPEELENNNNKRSRVDIMKRRISSPSGGRRTPVPSTRPSPTPFRTQMSSYSPSESRDPFPPSPSLPAVLPPHPRPIGTSGHAHVAPSASSSAIALPPIATLSPASTAPSPPNHNDRDDKMHVDSNRSTSPPSRGKLSDVIHPSTSASRSPPTKQRSSHSQSPPSEKEPSS